MLSPKNKKLRPSRGGSQKLATSTLHQEGLLKIENIRFSNTDPLPFELDYTAIVDMLCQRGITLPKGYSLKRLVHYLKCEDSHLIMKWCFWYIFCSYFQMDGELYLEGLAKQLSSVFIPFMFSIEGNKDRVLTHYPYAVAEIICLFFVNLFPLSHDLFDNDFHCQVYRSVARLLTGFSIATSSAQYLRQLLFPSLETSTLDALAGISRAAEFTTLSRSKDLGESGGKALSGVGEAEASGKQAGSSLAPPAASAAITTSPSAASLANTHLSLDDELSDADPVALFEFVPPSAELGPIAETQRLPLYCGKTRVANIIMDTTTYDNDEVLLGHTFNSASVSPLMHRFALSTMNHPIKAHSARERIHLTRPAKDSLDWMGHFESRVAEPVSSLPHNTLQSYLSSRDHSPSVSHRRPLSPLSGRYARPDSLPTLSLMESDSVNPPPPAGSSAVSTQNGSRTSLPSLSPHTHTHRRRSSSASVTFAPKPETSSTAPHTHTRSRTHGYTSSSGGVGGGGGKNSSPTLTPAGEKRSSGMKTGGVNGVKGKSKPKTSPQATKGGGDSRPGSSSGGGERGGEGEGEGEGGRDRAALDGDWVNARSEKQRERLCFSDDQRKRHALQERPRRIVDEYAAFKQQVASDIKHIHSRFSQEKALLDRREQYVLNGTEEEITQFCVDQVSNSAIASQMQGMHVDNRRHKRVFNYVSADDREAPGLSYDQGGRVIIGRSAGPSSGAGGVTIGGGRLKDRNLDSINVKFGTMTVVGKKRKNRRPNRKAPTGTFFVHQEYDEEEEWE